MAQKKKVSLIEKAQLQKNLNQVKKAIDNLDKLRQAAKKYRADVALLDIYRFLRTSKSYRTATDIVVHTENVDREVDALASSLRDAQMILLQQVQHFEKGFKPTA
jgi:inorganic pyrophosphatase